MKGRSGFVSNSSSSSFVCYGISVDLDELKEALKIEDEDMGVYEVGEEMEKRYPGFVAGTVYEDYSEVNVGRGYESIGDDETGKQFRDSVKDTLSKLLGKEVKPSHIEEASGQ